MRVTKPGARSMAFCVLAYLIHYIQLQSPGEPEQPGGGTGMVDALACSPDLLSAVPVDFYGSFRRREFLYEMAAESNLPHNLGAKLSSKLLYYVTNGYNPHDRSMVLFRAPFKADPARLELFNLTIYKPESVLVPLTLDESIGSVEVQDAFSSSDQVLVDWCTPHSLVGSPACAGGPLELTPGDRNASISIEVWPKKMGLTQFKVYFLYRVNGKFLSVYTLNGSFVATRPAGFSLWGPQALHPAPANQTTLLHLSVENKNNDTKNIANIRSADAGVRVNPPTKFEAKSLESEWSRKKFTGEGTQVWAVKAGERKRFAEVILDPSLSSSPQPRSKNSVLPSFDFETDFISRPYRDSSAADACIFLDKQTPAYEEQPDCPGLIPEYPREHREPDWPRLLKAPLAFDIQRTDFGYPLMVHLREAHYFWESQSLNFGVMCTRNLHQEVSVFAQNLRDRAVILRAITISNPNPDFRIQLVKAIRSQTIFPAKAGRTLIAKLVISFENPGVHFSLLSASLIAHLQFNGTDIQERLGLHGAFSAAMFSLRADGKYDVGVNDTHHGVMVRQNIASHIFISQIEVKNLPGNDDNFVVENLMNSLSFSDFENFESEYTTRVLEVVFKKPAPDKPIFRNRFVVTAHSLENTFIFGVEFVYRMLLCQEVPGDDAGAAESPPAPAQQESLPGVTDTAKDCKWGPNYKEPNDLWLGHRKEPDPAILSELRSQGREGIGPSAAAKPDLFDCHKIKPIQFEPFSPFKLIQYRRLRVINNSFSQFFFPKIEMGPDDPRYSLALDLYVFSRGPAGDQRLRCLSHFALDAKANRTLSFHQLLEGQGHFLLIFRVEFRSDAKFDRSQTFFSRRVTLSRHDSDLERTTPTHFDLKFAFCRGQLAPVLPAHEFEILFPGSNYTKAVRLSSTFPIDLNITSIRPKGRAKMVFQATLIDSVVRPHQPVDNLMLYATPFNLIDPTGYLPPKGDRLTEINTVDIQRTVICDPVWDAVRRNEIISFNASVLLETSVNQTVTVPLRGRFKRAELAPRLVLGPQTDSPHRPASLVVRNPYPHALEVSFFVVPSIFSDINQVNGELQRHLWTKISQKPPEVWCFHSNKVPFDGLKGFVESLAKTGPPLEGAWRFGNPPACPACGHNTATVCVELPRDSASRNALRDRFGSESHPFVNTTVHNKYPPHAMVDNVDVYKLDHINEYNAIAPQSDSAKGFWSATWERVFGPGSPASPRRRRSRATVPSPPNVTATSLFHIPDFPQYVQNKSIFRHPGLETEVFLLPPGKSLEIHNAFLVDAQANLTRLTEDFVILAKTNVSFTFISRLEIASRTTGVGVDYGDHKVEPEFRASASFSEVTYATLHHKPMVLHFGLKNTGRRTVKIRQIRVISGYQNSNCFEIRRVRMAALQPNATLRLAFIMRLSEKASWGYSAQVLIETRRLNLTMPLRVRFEDFYVAGEPHPGAALTTKAVLWGIVLALFFGLVEYLRTVFVGFMKNSRVEPKGSSCVFLGSQDRKEKLELYSHRVKAGVHSCVGPDYPHIWAVPSTTSTPEDPKKIFWGRRKKQVLPKKIGSKLGPGPEPAARKGDSGASSPNLSMGNPSFTDGLREGSPKSGEPTPPGSNRRLEPDAESRSDMPNNQSVGHSGREASTNFKLKKPTKVPESVLSLNRVILGLQSHEEIPEMDSPEDSQPVNTGDVEEERSIQESLERAFGLQDSYTTDKRPRKYSYRLKQRGASDAQKKPWLNTDFRQPSNITYSTLLEIMQRAQNQMQSK